MKKKWIMYIFGIILFLIPMTTTYGQETIRSKPDYVAVNNTVGTSVFSETGRYSLGALGNNQVVARSMPESGASPGGNNPHKYYLFDSMIGSRTNNATSATYAPKSGGKLKKAIFYVLVNNGSYVPPKVGQNSYLKGPKGDTLKFSSVFQGNTQGAYDITDFLNAQGAGVYEFHNFDVGSNRVRDNDGYAVWNISYVEEHPSNPIRRTVMTYFGLPRSISASEPVTLSVGGEVGFRGAKKTGEMSNSTLVVTAGAESFLKFPNSTEKFTFKSVVPGKPEQVANYDKGERVKDAMNETYTRDGALFGKTELRPYPAFLESDIIIDNNLSAKYIPLGTTKVTGQVLAASNYGSTSLGPGTFGLGLEMDYPDITFGTKWLNQGTKIQKVGKNEVVLESKLTVNRKEMMLKNQYILLDWLNSFKGITQDVFDFGQIKVNQQVVNAQWTKEGLKVPISDTVTNDITVSIPIKVNNKAKAYERTIKYLNQVADNIEMSFNYDLVYPDGTTAKDIQHQQKNTMTAIPDVGKVLVRHLDKKTNAILRAETSSYDFVGENYVNTEPENIPNFRFSNMESTAGNVFEMPTKAKPEGRVTFYYLGTVKMKVEQINKVDQKAIYSQLSPPKRVTNTFEVEVGIGEDIQTHLKEIFDAEKLTLNYEGYNDLFVENYLVNNQKVTVVPDNDFKVTYQYQPKMEMKKVPSLNFGKVAITPQESTTYKVKNADTLLEVINTFPDNTPEVKLALEENKIVADKTKRKFIGQLFFNKSERLIPINQNAIRVQELLKDVPYAKFEMNSDADHFSLVQKTGNLADTYYGKLLWTFEDKPDA